MDDYTLSSLSESKNEWSIRLVNILTPTIIDGIRSIFNEALDLCQQNKEEDQYLLTFQTFLSRIPKWNNNIIEEECKRIQENSKCGYLEELISCVHVVQLKALTCVRVGSKQKKVDIDIPCLNDFIHKVYINVARTLYSNVYLFQYDIMPLDKQKNNREFENIVKEAILNSIRETMPIENILKAYLDVTEELETNVEEEVLIEPVDISSSEVKNTSEVDAVVSTEDKVENDIKESKVEEEEKREEENKGKDVDDSKRSNIEFSDLDHTIDTLGNKDTVEVPKTEENLNRIEEQRQLNEEQEDDDDSDTLTIGDDVSLELTDINDLNKPVEINTSPLILDDIELLE